MRREKPDHVLATLVFTDIVASSQVAEELGDRRWRELLARHHRIVREGLREYGGRELDTAGDGVFARFESPASAIHFTASTGDALRELGVEIRAGIHIGECEVFDGKLSGVNVHAAARTMGLAGAGEILVTGSVRDLVRGGGFGFDDRGVHELRGIEGEWRLYELTSIDDSHRSPPMPEGEAKARRGQIEPPPLVQRRRVRLGALALAIVGAIVVIVGGVGFALDRTGGASAGPVTGCELTSNAPLNDLAFNQAVYDGLTKASTDWGIDVKDKVSHSSPSNEWTRHLNELIRQRCGLIVTMGSSVGSETAVAAKANRNVDFATTDDDNVQGTSNLLAIVFKPEQPAFLAGFLAAAMSKTHKVATFGGIPIPPVTGYMNGFAAGILYYNGVHGTRVRLLGWDPKTQTGSFVSSDPTDFPAFGDTNGAAALTAEFVLRGADVIFPVDGPYGERGSCRVAQRAHNVRLIGVDTDQHYSTPDCVSQWLTSAMKIYKRMVYVAMRQVVHHSFNGGRLYGTLANRGVGLAPYYGAVPSGLQSELKRVKRGIENHSISVDPQSYQSG
jgi:basic membrane protein A and related proteins